MINGRQVFYRNAVKDLKVYGYRVWLEDVDYRGKSRSHRKKPDFIALKNGIIIIGESKGPHEPPTTRSWRQVQNSDTARFRDVRRTIVARERAGSLAPEVGGWCIIILGQVPDYVDCLKLTYDLPSTVKNYREIRCAVRAPANEAKSIEQALSDCGKKPYVRLNGCTGTVTYLYA